MIDHLTMDKVLMEAAQPVMRKDYEDVAAWNSAKEIYYKIATLTTTMVRKPLFAMFFLYITQLLISLTCRSSWAAHINLNRSRFFKMKYSI